MKNKTLNHYAIIVLFFLIFLSIHKATFAQRSIFGKDTAIFNYYRTAQVPTRNITRVVVVDRTVNWMEIFDSIKQSNANGDIDYLKSIFPFTDENAKQLIVKFKVIKKDNFFCYISDSDSSKVLFSAFLNDKDTIRKVPFFCYPASISNCTDTTLDYGLVYNNDTTIDVKGIKISCHRFVRYFNNFGQSFDRFTIQYTEVFFEKESCLPVYFTNRVCQAMAAEDDDRLQPELMYYKKNFIRLE